MTIREAAAILGLNLRQTLEIVEKKIGGNVGREEAIRALEQAKKLADTKNSIQGKNRLQYENSAFLRPQQSSAARPRTGAPGRPQAHTGGAASANACT